MTNTNIQPKGIALNLENAKRTNSIMADILASIFNETPMLVTDHDTGEVQALSHDEKLELLHDHLLALGNDLDELSARLAQVSTILKQVKIALVEEEGEEEKGSD